MIKKMLIALIGIFLCVVAGLLLAATLGSRFTGRDFRLSATIAGILIILFSILLRAKYRWSINSLLISLVPVEVVTMYLIMVGSGSYSIDLFNLRWIAGLNLYLALPWFIGISIGSIIFRTKITGYNTNVVHKKEDNEIRTL